MTTPIRPSLAQMLNPQTAAPARPAAQATPQAGGFTAAVTAQKAFFQQITQPKIAPANYTAADIAQATRSAQPASPAPTTTAAAAPTAADPAQALKRPGSYLNIVI